MSQPTTIASRYRLDVLIGQGAMGSVYAGVDETTQTPVAVKALKPDIVSSNADMVERFRREGQALRELSHPNIVAMLAYVEDDGGHYIIMEHVTGGSLRDLLDKKTRLSEKQTLQIGLDLADALTRAHRLNIIHRDLKPANILIAADGTPRLSDFGIAHMGDYSHALTEAGSLVGTYAYLSPELCLGMPVDERADVWAFGVILFEMLTGERPFKGQAPGTIIAGILNSPVPDLQAMRPDLNEDLVDLVYRMLDKSPQGRIPSVRLVGAAIDNLLKGRPATTHATGNLPTPVPSDGRGKFQTPTPTPGKADRHDNLPEDVTPFVGRDDELAELARLLADPDIRLITVQAPGGMGKTRLTVEAARRQSHAYENGAAMVQLAPLEDPAGIVAAIAEALDYQFTGEQSEHDDLMNFLSSKELLLVVDNFEHVIDGAGIVADIIQAAPRVTVIVSSRQKLNLRGETVYTIGGMDFPEWETPEDAMRYSAVQLFMESARRTMAGFELQAEDLDYVARICRLVQGMPLGILLAAAWVDALSLEEIAEEITASADFLESEMQDLPDRQRSMRAVFDYSWRLLDDAERDTFARLSVFRGGFDRKAASHITGASIRMLTNLVHKSLLQRDAASGRYALHELLRQYAEEVLDASGDAEHLRHEHGDYYLGFLANRTDDLKGKRQVAALNEIDDEFDNIRAALRHAMEDGHADLVDATIDAMGLFVMFRSRFVEGAELLEYAQQTWPLEGSDNPMLAAKLASRVAPFKADLEAKVEPALAILREHGAESEVAYALTALGRHRVHQLQDADGLTLQLEALDIYRKLGDEFMEAMVLDDLSWSYNLLGNYEKRQSTADEFIAIRRRIGDRVGVANSTRSQGGIAWTVGDYEKGAEYFRESLAISREVGNKMGVAWNIILLAQMTAIQGDIKTALAMVGEGFQIAKQINLPPLMAMAIMLESVSAGIMEDYDLSARRVAAAREQLKHNDDAFVAGMLGFADAMVAVGRDQYDEAENTLQFIFSNEFVVRDEQSIRPYFTIGLMLMVYQERYEEAAAWLGNLQASVDPFSMLLATWPKLKEAEATLRKELGDDTFQQVTQEGAAYDLLDFPAAYMQKD